MDTRHIKEFAVLAEVGNYLAASELLFISQSTLSKHIQALEAELGAPVFDRSTRHVRLNEVGRTFLVFAQQVTALQYETTTRIRRLSEHQEQALTIGAIPIMAPYGITDAIAAFKRDNPDFSVTLVEGDAGAMRQAVRQGECDLAFIRDDGVDDPAFCKLPFAVDFLAAVLPVTHPLAARKSLPLDRLAGEDFLLLTPGSLVHGASLRACRDAGFDPHVVFTGQRAENIIDLVAQGMGVGLLMRKAARRLLRPDVAAVEVTPTVETHVKIYYRANTALPDTARHFIDSLFVHRTITR